MEDFQKQQQEEFKREEEKQKRIVKSCTKCGAELDEEALFCPECGEKVGGEERECPDCKTMTSADYCPNCGYKMTPAFCPNCGAETHYPFCMECGSAVDQSFALAMEEQEKQLEEAKKVHEPRMATEEEAKAFEEEVQSSISEELKYFTKKIQEHRILKQEREYFNAREKRIVKVLGKNGLSFSLPDPEEMAYSTKVYRELKKIIVEKRERANKEELERLFPDIYKAQQDEKERARQLKEREEARQKELELQKKELEEKYKKIEDNIRKDIKDAVEAEKERVRIAEEKRREEERLKKEAEEKKLHEEAERRRREREYQKKLEEQRNKQFLGMWVAPGDSGTFIKIIDKAGSRVKGLSDGLKHNLMHVSGFFSGEIRGDAINLIFERYTKREEGCTHCDTFFGNFTPDGNIRGGWTNNDDDYYDLWYKF